MRPPSGVNLTALDRRLSTICLSRRWSAWSRMPWRDVGGERRARLSSARAETTRMASLRKRPSRTSCRSSRMRPASIFDMSRMSLMTSSRYWPLWWMSRQYSPYFSAAERAEHARLHDLGEADDGVERRAQLVAHIGEEFDLAWLASSARVFSSAYFSARSASSSACRSSVCCERAQVGDRRDQALLALHQLFFVQLDGGDVGADRDVAAVLGAPLADVQPAAVVELRLEGAGARDLAFAGDLGAHHRLAPGGDHGVVGGAGLDRLVRQVVQLLEVRIAQHQAIVRVPHHEGFRDGLDGVAQPQVRLGGLLDQRLLLGDVDRDADQVRAAARRAGARARSARAARPNCRWRAARGSRDR